MAHGDFVWCDLSSFNVEQTKSFYTRLFGWDYRPTTQPDGSVYEIGRMGGAANAGIFEMPQRFQEMGLPSFWMSYIEVDDVAACVHTAAARGGKVEVGPIPFGDDAQIALIRDPLGGGFTVYQGSGMQPRALRPAPGQMAWNALYITDPDQVIDFYAAMFGWTIAETPDRDGVHAVSGPGGRQITSIQKVPKELTEGFEFWGVHFAVADLQTTESRIAEAGGEVVYRETEGERPMLLARDPDGAAFFVEAADASARQSSTTASSSRPLKWKTLLGLAVIFTAVLFNINAVWSALFIMWTIPALRSGDTFFVERISRHTEPALFWVIVSTWIVLSAYLIVADIWRWTGGG